MSFKSKIIGIQPEDRTKSRYILHFENMDRDPYGLYVGKQELIRIIWGEGKILGKRVEVNQEEKLFRFID